MLSFVFPEMITRNTFFYFDPEFPLRIVEANLLYVESHQISATCAPFSPVSSPPCSLISAHDQAQELLLQKMWETACDYGQRAADKDDNEEEEQQQQIRVRRRKRAQRLNRNLASRIASPHASSSSSRLARAPVLRVRRKLDHCT